MEPHFNESKIWNHIEEICGAFLMFAMLILLFGQVVLRFIFQKSSPIVEEYSLYMFLYFVYFVSSNAFLRNEHIKIEALVSKFPAAVQLLIVFLVHIANIVFSVIIVKYGMERVMSQMAMGTKSATMFPLWVQTFSLPLGMIFSTIRSVQYIYLTIRFEILHKGGAN